MKKLLFFTLSLFAWAQSLYAATVSAEVDGIKYTIDTTLKEASVSQNTVNLTIENLVIPDYIDYNGEQYPVTSIKNSAFLDCTRLTGTLTIGNSVTSIGNFAFSGCKGLTGSLTIPNSVTSIGNYAFSMCNGLTSVIIGDSVTTIGNHAFSMCKGITSLTLSNSITSIGDYAFTICSGLTGSLAIPNSVTYIGEYAFNDCSGLTNVSIGNSVTSIGEDAFSGCSGLTGTLTIPNSVTSIGEKAFYGCSGLTELSIGNSVTTIGKFAFFYCKFNKIICEATTPPVIGELRDGAFNFDTYYDVPLFVPSESIPLYQEAFDWKKFKNISAIEVEPGGIDEVEIDADTEVEVYTLGGVFVYKGLWSEARLSKGFYIVRQGNAAQKVYVSNNQL